ncbi:unnamed protein product [Phytomonas sp. Hart1]|nr:unnamed protein product [Phytomonas sp. Hart1]|eukprot:CCW70539.1 unnamed protein product [Phytomonas sp. isolate Hart1]
MGFHYFSDSGCGVEPGMVRLGIAVYGVLSVNIIFFGLKHSINTTFIPVEGSEIVSGDTKLFSESLIQGIKSNYSKEAHQTLTSVSMPLTNGIGSEKVIKIGKKKLIT